MTTVKIYVVNDSPNELPQYATKNDSGMDLRAWVDSKKHCFIQGTARGKDKEGNEVINIMPGGRCAIDTGLHIGLPDGYEAQVRPRSGMALKKGITVLNTPGTIDCGFRGNIGVIIANLSDQIFTIHDGDRIAQLVIAPVVQGELTLVDELDKTERADGAFGHSGIK